MSVKLVLLKGLKAVTLAPTNKRTESGSTAKSGTGSLSSGQKSSIFGEKTGNSSDFGGKSNINIKLSRKNFCLIGACGKSGTSTDFGGKSNNTSSYKIPSAKGYADLGSKRSTNLDLIEKNSMAKTENIRNVKSSAPLDSNVTNVLDLSNKSNILYARNSPIARSKIPIGGSVKSRFFDCGEKNNSMTTSYLVNSGKITDSSFSKDKLVNQFNMTGEKEKNTKLDSKIKINSEINVESSYGSAKPVETNQTTRSSINSKNKTFCISEMNVSKLRPIKNMTRHIPNTPGLFAITGMNNNNLHAEKIKKESHNSRDNGMHANAMGTNSTNLSGLSDKCIKSLGAVANINNSFEKKAMTENKQINNSTNNSDLFVLPTASAKKNENTPKNAKKGAILEVSIKSTMDFNRNANYDTSTLKSEVKLNSTVTSVKSPEKGQSESLCSNYKPKDIVTKNIKDSADVGAKKKTKNNSESSEKSSKKFSSAGEKTVCKGDSDGKNNAFVPPPKNESNTDFNEKAEKNFNDDDTNKRYCDTREENEDLFGVNIKNSLDTDDVKNNQYISSVKNDNNLNTGGKSSSNSSRKSGNTFSTERKRSTDVLSVKNYEPVSNSTPKSKKHKSTFGIIWIPTRKHKKKDYIYHPHNDDYKERSPTMYPFMSGDSSENQPFKEKAEQELLVSEKIKSQPVTSSGSGLRLDDIEENSERQELFKHDHDDGKEAAGDTYDDEKESSLKKSDKDDYLEDNNVKNKSPQSKWQKDKLGDKVDSVYLRPPPPHKTRSTASTAPEEEDCGMKCLYYTLQCCDCVIM